MTPGVGPRVVAVCASERHDFSKSTRLQIRLVEGLGIEGDAHAGATVQHLYDMRRDPNRPNLRQVHLLQSELLDELATRGFEVRPGDLGENITTRGVDLLNLPRGTLLRIGPDATVEVTGLRSPCVKIDRFEPGLLAAVRDRVDGRYVGRTGVMGIVRAGGEIGPGDSIDIVLPPHPHEKLVPV